MPTGKTLDELVTDLRAEIGDSTNPSMGIDGLPGLRQTLRRVQETYYEDFDWPHLLVSRDETIIAGERYYTFNEGVNFERITKAEIKIAGRWRELDYGIDNCHYNESDSDEGRVGQPRRWQHYEDGQFELWPIPDTATIVRFRCMKPLDALSASADRCVLDSNLIVLGAAAELLAREKSDDAPIKVQLATALYNRLKARSQKKRMFRLGGDPHAVHGRPPIRVPRS